MLAGFLFADARFRAQLRRNFEHAARSRNVSIAALVER
jgi:hypothetical protein